MKFVLDVEATLPADGTAGTLVGRLWRPDVQGPSVVAVRADGVYDISRSFPTMRDLGETGDPATSVAAAQGERIGTVASILVNTPEIERDQARPWLGTGRPAGDQGRRRHLRGLPHRTRD